MKLPSITLLLALTGSSVVATASTHVSVGISIGAPAPVIVREAPPRRFVETVVATPGPGYVWVAGHHSWRGRGWVWVPGVWVTPPQAGTVWVEGRWNETTGAWIEGHWEIGPIAPPTPAPIVVTSAPRPEVIIYSPPPPPRFERRGRAPGPDFVWVGGYWSYRGGRHIWVAGRWDRPPHGCHAWVSPRWDRRGGNYVFVEGCWK